MVDPIKVATPQPQKAAPVPADAPSVNAPLQTQRVDNRDVLELARQATSVGRTMPKTDLLDETIIAKPLVVGEGFFDLKPKNPNVIFRGINRGVNTSEGVSFLRYDQARVQGFVNVTVNDVAGEVPPMYQRDNGTKIIYGDLILMMIDKARYRGALKYKEQQAIRATSRAGAVDGGNAQIAKAAMEHNIPPNLARKLQPFSPTTKDVGGDEET